MNILIRGVVFLLLTLSVFLVNAEQPTNSTDDVFLSQLGIDTDELMKDLSLIGVQLNHDPSQDKASEQLHNNDINSNKFANQTDTVSSGHDVQSRGQSYNLPQAQIIESTNKKTSGLIINDKNKVVRSDAELLKEYIATADGKSADGFYYKIKKMGKGSYKVKSKVIFSLIEKTASGKLVSKGDFSINYNLLPPLILSAISIVGVGGEINLITSAYNMYKSSGANSGMAKNKLLKYNIKLHEKIG